MERQLAKLTVQNSSWMHGIWKQKTVSGGEMDRVPAGQFSFILLAASDTLPTPLNLMC